MRHDRGKGLRPQCAAKPLHEDLKVAQNGGPENGTNFWTTRRSQLTGSQQSGPGQFGPNSRPAWWAQKLVPFSGSALRIEVQTKCVQSLRHTIWPPPSTPLSQRFPTRRSRSHGEGFRSSQKQPESARVSQRQPEAVRSNQKQPKAARGKKEAVRGSQKQPEAVRSSQKQPEAARSSQRQPEAARGSQRQSEAA